MNNEDGTIKLTGINYAINNGVTTAINATFVGYYNGQSINATIAVIGDELDDLTRKQVEEKARESLKTYVANGTLNTAQPVADTTAAE